MDVHSVDARTGTSRGVVATETTAAELDRCCSAALAAGDDWETWPRRERAAVLDAFASVIEADAPRLVAEADAETALGITRLSGEIARTTNQLRFFAEVVREGTYLAIAIDHARADVVPPRPDLRRRMVPIGPVAVFAAGNFPFAFSVAGGDTASCLAAGCSVVVKAHPGHPATSIAVHRLLSDVLAEHDAPGVVSLVHGVEAGTALVGHSAIRAASFTGSLRGGRALAAIAACRTDPIPFYGEFGSVNPVVVTAAAAAERGEQIGTGLATSATLSGGQFCTKPGVWLIPQGPAGDVVMAAAASALVAAGPVVLLNDRTAAAYVDQSTRLRADDRTTVRAVTPTSTAGRAVSPLLLEVAAGAVDGLLLEECFGPAAVAARYADTAEVDRVLAAVGGSLTATIHRGAGEDVTSLTARLTRLAGRVVFDGYPTGVGVTWSMTHGGPWPATSLPGTSVGARAIDRFLRPVTLQDAPAHVLPDELRDDASDVPRRVDGVFAPR